MLKNYIVSYCVIKIQVSPLAGSSELGWQWRDVEIEAAGAVVRIKLWSKLSERELLPGNRVTVTNVRIKEFYGQKQAESTDESDLEVTQFYFVFINQAGNHIVYSSYSKHSIVRFPYCVFFKNMPLAL